MRYVHFDHWWVSSSEMLALSVLQRALEAEGVLFTDDPEQADVHAVLMSAQRVWEGVRGRGSRPINLSAYLTPFDLEARVFAPFRAVDSPSHLSLYGVPLGASRNNSLWVNRRIADQVGGPPQSMPEWTEWLQRASKIVPYPLELGRENWQVALLFEVIVLAMHGDDFHRRAFGMGLTAALSSPRMAESLAFLQSLARFIAPPDDAIAWHVAAADCQDGRCATVVMGDWIHNEFKRKDKHNSSDYESIYKWVIPGTDSSFLYNVDYVVPLQRRNRPTDPSVLATLTRTLLRPAVQCEFGMVKGALPAVRDAVAPTIDAASWKMFHLATLCPEILIPSMSLLQGSPRVMRDTIAAAARSLLFASGSVAAAHRAIQGLASCDDLSACYVPVSAFEEHDSSSRKRLVWPDRHPRNTQPTPLENCWKATGSSTDELPQLR